jgi:hypothetical protein
MAVGRGAAEGRLQLRVVDERGVEVGTASRPVKPNEADVEIPVAMGIGEFTVTADDGNGNRFEGKVEVKSLVASDEVVEIPRAR